MAKSSENRAPEIQAHLEWLGYVQPVGLVVSVPALLDAQSYVNRNITPDHQRFLESLATNELGEPVPAIADLGDFAERVLGWEASDLVALPPEPTSDAERGLEVVLPQYNETLRPTHAVRELHPKEGASPWLMLVQELPHGVGLDVPREADSARHWSAPPQAKFERLLRETGVPIGLLVGYESVRQPGTEGVEYQQLLRLVYAPKGESSGHMTFKVAEMMQVAGRPIFAALHMLLSAERIFTLGDNQRLPAILENSRKYQNTVSTKLAEQVLAALYELMRGFQAADDARHGDLLRDVLADDPNHVYAGLLTTLLRLVFVMYAEDRDLLSSDPVYTNHYSVTGLYARLREENGRYPDTMDQRYGAWSQLVTLFRLIYEGGTHGEFRIPPRKGYLFDPDRYPFLEGRQQSGEDPGTTIPRVSDGVVFRVLNNLLLLDGERLSYRALDVEQIGSVYETVMGFNLEVARGRAIAIKPVKTHGAPATIDLDELLATPSAKRAKWLEDHAGQKLTGQALTSLKEAKSIEDLLVALDKKIQKKVTPNVVPAGAMVLQPSDERRRSGSHYTPRSLTEPIVRTTLEPILAQLVATDSPLPEVPEPTAAERKRYTKGELAERARLARLRREHAEAGRRVGTPHPSQILDLKVCDPAMGSGAFLVEACRQLADQLVQSWYAHAMVPTDLPPDEDELLYARRLVAQRCLYGVDKNPMAVDLARLSLWLVTLARDHPFTFLDHSLRHGDSLVGLTRQQIIGFHWEPKKQKQFGADQIQKLLDRATEARAKILEAREDAPYRDQEQRLASADEALEPVRLTADACVSAFFAGSKKKQREERCELLQGLVSDWYTSGLDPAKRPPIEQAVNQLRGTTPESRTPNPQSRVEPFHWEIEFPEVFARKNGGFDAFVGNPPFLGGTNISSQQGKLFLGWLMEVYPQSGGRMDLCAYFLRLAFSKVRQDGTLGLISTNTIAQGDTRNGGLGWIARNGGSIYAARRRLLWPGQAAVIVSVVHVCKCAWTDRRKLDGKSVESITAYLFSTGGNDDPKRLVANANGAGKGCDLYGQGFLFADDDAKCTPITTLNTLVQANPRNKERVFPYLGGRELNSDPSQSHDRWAINFGSMTLDEAANWPDLLEIVREKVKPERATKAADVAAHPWWQYWRTRDHLYRALECFDTALVMSRVSSHFAISKVPTRLIFADSLVVFALPEARGFATLQSRPHEAWARFFGSSMKDDLRYTPSDCFETFPFPKEAEINESLENAGREYYEYRGDLMIKNNEGLTTTYNRFHDPYEKSPEIVKLRELHAAMDDAVLRAYGWDDLADRAAQPGGCEFLLDYEEELGDGDSGLGTGEGKKSKKKKPWRYRWPDDFRDEVLARLLELNAERHREEMLAGPPSKGDNTKAKAQRGRKKKTVERELFELD